MGLLDTIDNLLGTRLGLLVNDPRAAMAQMNQQAGAFNQASLLATQAERNAMRGLPITPEQAAAKQYVDKATEDLAMGFAGSTSPTKKIYRGSYDESPLYKVQENYVGNDIFGGVFGSPRLEAAKSHGSGSVHYTEIPENQILKQQDFNVIPVNDVKNALLKARPDLKNNKSLFDKVYDIVINDPTQNITKYSDDVIKNAFKKSDLGEASWEAQRLRGQVSKNLGFKAVEMVDEHGLSYLVSPGAEFKQLYKPEPVIKSAPYKPEFTGISRRKRNFVEK